MKIVYIGPLWKGGTCLMRMHALQKLGHEIIPIDTEPKINRRFITRFMEHMMYKMRYPLDSLKINEQLLGSIKVWQPDMVWIDKGLLIWPETLKLIKKDNQNLIVIGYSPDDMVNKHNQSNYFLAGLHHYDIFLTTKTFNVPELINMGAKRVIFIPNAYDPDIHYPITISQEDRLNIGGSVGFIGAWEYERSQHILALAHVGIKVRVWGGWKNQYGFNIHPNLIIENRSLWANDYTKAICSFDINLGFLRKINRDQQTTRSIEIPACGAFMLAERTDEHLALFKEGKEAEFFSSVEELIEKTKFYLENDDLRRKIAIAGRERCLRSNYDYPNRIKLALNNMMEDEDYA